MKMPSGNYSADPANERWDDRTERLLGFDAMERLRDASVLIVGAGGVGGYAAEMLVRSGIGKMTVIDADNVAESNINRQLIALRSNVGRSKAIMYAERFHDINPEAVIDALQMYVGEDEVDEILDGDFDYVLDCIDTVGPKAALLSRCLRRRVPVVSSMGAGGRIDPTLYLYPLLIEQQERLAFVPHPVHRVLLKNPLLFLRSHLQKLSVLSIFLIESDYI